jgi:hypothetical protein
LGADTIIIPRVSEEPLTPLTVCRSQTDSNTNDSFDLGDTPAKGSTARTEVSISSWSGSDLKRVFDFVCVAILLPFLSPVFLILGLAVLATSSGPVFFLQKRTGQRRRTFTILKFRTMEDLSEGERNNVTTTPLEAGRIASITERPDRGYELGRPKAENSRTSDRRSPMPSWNYWSSYDCFR